MRSRIVGYEHEGVALEGVLCFDETVDAARPAVLVSHAYCGRGELEIERATELVGLGYVGFALDMYGNGVRGADPEECAALMEPFMADRALLQRRQQAALEAVRAQPEVDPGRVAAIGFCFGGLCVLDLARSGVDVRGVVSFHGLLGAPGNTVGTSIRAKVLILHGRDDPLAPPADVLAVEEELTEAGADWQLHAFGHAMHAFTNPNANNPGGGVRYDRAAARRAWSLMQDFLQEAFE